MDQRPPYPRPTARPPRRGGIFRWIGRSAFLAVAALIALAAWELGSGVGGGARLSEAPGCIGLDCFGQTSAAAAPVAPTPCPYCSLDPNRWQAQTAVRPPEIGGKAAAVVEGSCGDLIYGLNHDERQPPASLTKIVTALVVMDRARLKDRVPITLNGWDLSAEDESSIMGLEAGMDLSVEELLYGMLLPSGNDAALQLAQHLGGERQVVAQMNRRIARMGLANTHFVNPDGRDAPDHYSSALDMALLGRELMTNATLRTIVGTDKFMPEWNGQLLWNSNYLLYIYEGANGVKTGYTEGASFTIVSAAERHGRQLYASVMHSWNLYGDSIGLLNWAFANTRSSC